VKNEKNENENEIKNNDIIVEYFMKYMSIKYKHIHNKRQNKTQTRKTFRGGSNEDDRLEETIKFFQEV